MTKGEHDRALAEYTRAIELDPRFGSAYTGRAELNRKMGRWADGLADAEQALSLDPNNPFAHDTRAHILEALGKRKEAIAEHKKALAIKPDLQESIDGLKDLTGTSPPGNR
jgi:tetratricopeptide (TPR) repeat protein